VVVVQEVAEVTKKLKIIIFIIEQFK